MNPPVHERHLLRGVEPVLAAWHHLERGAGPAREIGDRRQRCVIVILPVEDVRRHMPFDGMLPYVAQMLLVQRHALDAFQIDDGRDEIRCRNVPARERAHRVERPDAVRDDADAPAYALRQPVEKLRELALRLPRRLRPVIEADYLAAGEQRPVVLCLFWRAVLAVDVDEGTRLIHLKMFLISFLCSLRLHPELYSCFSFPFSLARAAMLS